jgi:hypothetical protein
MTSQTKTTKPKKNGKPAVPPILPREPLTKKAFAAVSQYATIKARDLPIHHFMVRYVLDAERMRRADLYAWLEQRGYKWFPRIGAWAKPQELKVKQ